MRGLLGWAYLLARPTALLPDLTSVVGGWGVGGYFVLLTFSHFVSICVAVIGGAVYLLHRRQNQHGIARIQLKTRETYLVMLCGAPLFLI